MSRPQPTDVYTVLQKDADYTLIQMDGKQARVKTAWLDFMAGGNAKATSWRTETHIRNAEWK